MNATGFLTVSDKVYQDKLVMPGIMFIKPFFNGQ